MPNPLRAGLRFACLGSGSRGNALLVEAGQTCILVDNGFSLRETRKRLGAVGREPHDVAAILVTHEHSDHLNGVAALARRHNIPVWTTRGTAGHASLRDLAQLRILNCHTAFGIDDLEIQPYPVPHDAREPCQFVFSEGGCRFGMLTDAGYITPHIVDRLGACDALFLECNHDVPMLAQGPYPQALKARVAGRFGHLSNTQAAGLLAAISVSALQHLVAGHLSEQNNTPALASTALSRVLGCEDDWVAIAPQDACLAWREVRPGGQA